MKRAETRSYNACSATNQRWYVRTYLELLGCRLDVHIHVEAVSRVIPAEEEREAGHEGHGYEQHGRKASGDGIFPPSFRRLRCYSDSLSGCGGAVQRRDEARGQGRCEV